MQSKWGCTRKVLARTSTIISRYRFLSGNTKVPLKKQYWTLGGECVDDFGLISNTEIWQILQAKLVHPYQIFSVDSNFKVYKINSRLIEINWIYGDFLEQIIQYKESQLFNPAIINFDSCYTPKKAVKKLSGIIQLVNSLDIHKVLVVCNTVLQSKFINISPKEAEEEMYNNIYISTLTRNNWSVDTPFIYRGVDGGTSLMSTFSFYKK